MAASLLKSGRMSIPGPCVINGKQSQMLLKVPDCMESPSFDDPEQNISLFPPFFLFWGCQTISGCSGRPKRLLDPKDSFKTMRLFLMGRLDKGSSTLHQSVLLHCEQSVVFWLCVSQWNLIDALCQ